MAQSQNGSIWKYGNNSAHNIQRRHISFIYAIETQSCFFRRGFELEGECDFVKQTNSCNGVAKLFNYLEYLVCAWDINSTSSYLVPLFLVFCAILCFWVAFMFLIIKYFILPNVIHVVQYMRLPLYDFGLTVIAVIISANQISWILYQCDDELNEDILVLGNMLGKVFTTYTIGLSVVCFAQHIKLPGREVIIHIIFLTVVFALSYGLIFTKLYGVQEDTFDIIDGRSIGFFFIACYVAFIVYIILMKRQEKWRSNKQDIRQKTSRVSKYNGCAQVRYALNPFKHMQSSGIVTGISLPIWILAAVQIPVIDKRRKMYGWCKYLTCMNIIIFPFMLYVQVQEISIFFIVMCLLSLALLIFTISKTKVQKPPKKKGFYAVLGMFLGFFNYFIIQGEMETIFWQLFTYVFSVPTDIIMLTGYTFQSIINIVIFCYELVVMDLGNLAFGVVIGITLNQVVFILPIATFQICSDETSIPAVNANTTTCFVFVMITFIVSIFCLSLTNFKLRISQGIFFASIYIIFIIFIILSGAHVIHPYGGVHTSASTRQKELSTWA